MRNFTVADPYPGRSRVIAQPQVFGGAVDIERKDECCSFRPKPG